MIGGRTSIYNVNSRLKLIGRPKKMVITLIYRIIIEDEDQKNKNVTTVLEGEKKEERVFALIRYVVHNECLVGLSLAHDCLGLMAMMLFFQSTR